MGNMARPGYMSSTSGTWPYTYNESVAGVGVIKKGRLAGGLAAGSMQLPGICCCPGGHIDGSRRWLLLLLTGKAAQCTLHPALQVQGPRRGLRVY